MATDKTPRPEQLEDLASLIREERFLLLSDPGTGKTIPACLWLYWNWVTLQKRSVWVMPKTLLKKNVDELLEWSEFQPDEVVIYKGGKMPSEAKCLIMTFDRWKLAWRELLKTYPDIDALCIDEIQSGYKKNDSQRTQELYASMMKIKRMCGMSGSLIAGGLDTAYPMIHLIEPRYYTGLDNFMAIHAITDEYGKTIGWTNHARVGKILAKHGSSRSFEQVFGKENKVLQVEEVEMAPTQRAKYDEFEEKGLLELEDRWLQSSSGGVNALRCRQIMAHPECVRLPIAHDIKGKPITWKEYNLIGNETTGKDERLLLHFQNHFDRKEQLAVFGCFEAEIDRISALSKKVGLRTEVIDGRVSSKRRGEIDEAMRKKWLDNLIATCATAGVGLNWPDLNHMIFASMDYQDDHFFQAYRRAMRGVRPHPLWITILAYRASMDYPLMRIVERKSRDAHQVDPNRQELSFDLSGPKKVEADKVSQPKPSIPQVLTPAEQFKLNMRQRKK